MISDRPVGVLSVIYSVFLTVQLQPQEISPPPTANLDRSNDKVYENVTGLVKAVIEMSSKIQPAPPEEYVPMVKVPRVYVTLPHESKYCRCVNVCKYNLVQFYMVFFLCIIGCRLGTSDFISHSG